MVDLRGLAIPEGLNRDDVKRAAAGQWARILQAAGLRAEQCRPGHKGPCPRCGGKDRFNPFKDIAESGGLWCRHCHNSESAPKAGDG
ncbi:MAG: primase-helicase zinc-binding domain-containing protein, partial [Planctomyces sp.]